MNQIPQCLAITGKLKEKNNNKLPTKDNKNKKIEEGPDFRMQNTLKINTRKPPHCQQFTQKFKINREEPWPIMQQLPEKKRYESILIFQGGKKQET